MILYRQSQREGKPPATDGWIGLQGLAECYPSPTTPHYTSAWGTVVLRVWQLALQCHLWFSLSNMTFSRLPFWPSGYDTVTVAICTSSLILTCYFLLLGIIRPPLGQTGLSAAKWFFMQKVHITGPLLATIPLTLKSRGVGLSLCLLLLIIYPGVWLCHKALTEDLSFFARNKLQKGPMAYRSAILTYLCFVRALISNGNLDTLVIGAAGSILKPDGTTILTQAPAAIYTILIFLYSLFEACQVYPANNWLQDQRIETFLLSTCDWAFAAGTFVQFTSIIAPKLWIPDPILTPDLVIVIVGITMGIWARDRFHRRVVGNLYSLTKDVLDTSKASSTRRTEQMNSGKLLEELKSIDQLQICYNMTEARSQNENNEYLALITSWIFAHMQSCQASEHNKDDCFCFLLKKYQHDRELLNLLNAGSMGKQASYKTLTFGMEKDPSQNQVSESGLKLQLLLNASEGLLAHTLATNQAASGFGFDSTALASIDDPKTANLIRKMTERNWQSSRPKFKVKANKDQPNTFEITNHAPEKQESVGEQMYTLDLRQFPLFLAKRMVAIKSKLSGLKTLGRATKLDVCITTVKFLLSEVKNPLAALVHLYKAQNAEFAQGVSSYYKHWQLWDLGRAARQTLQATAAHRTSRGPHDLDISRVFDFRRRLAQVENSTKRILEAKIAFYETLYSQENLVTNYENNFYKSLLRDGSRLYDDSKKNRRLIYSLLNLHNKNIRLTIQAVINDLIIQERLKLSLRVETKLAEFAEWSSRRWRNDRTTSQEASTLLSKPNDDKLMHQVYQDETITAFLKYEDGDFRIRSASRNAGPLFGVSAEALLTANVKDFLPTGLQDHHDLLLWRFLNGVDGPLPTAKAESSVEYLQSLVDAAQRHTGAKSSAPIRSVLVPRSKLDASRVKVIPRLEVHFTQEVLLAAFLLPEKARESESFVLVDQTGKVLGMRANTHYLPADLVGEDISLYCPRVWPLQQVPVIGGHEAPGGPKSQQVFFRFDTTKFQTKGLKRAQAVLGKTQKFTSNLKRVRLDGKQDDKHTKGLRLPLSTKPTISLSKDEIQAKPTQGQFGNLQDFLDGAGDDLLQIDHTLSPKLSISPELAKGQGLLPRASQQLEAFDLKSFWMNSGGVKTVTGHASVECIFDRPDVDTKLYIINFRSLKEPDSNTTALISLLETAIPIYDLLKQDPSAVSGELEKIASKLRNCDDLWLPKKLGGYLPVVSISQSKFSGKPQKDQLLAKPSTNQGDSGAERRQQLMKMRMQTPIPTKHTALEEDGPSTPEELDRQMESEEMSMTTALPPTTNAVENELVKLVKKWTSYDIGHLDNLKSLLMMLGNTPVSSAQQAGTVAVEAPSSSGIQAPDLAGLLRMGLGKGRDVLGVLQGVQRRAKGLDELHKNETDIEWEAKSSKGGSNMTDGSRNNSSALTRFNIKSSHHRLSYKPLEFALYMLYSVLLLGWFIAELVLISQMDKLYNYQFGVYEISTIARPVGLVYRESVKTIIGSAILQQLGAVEKPADPYSKWLTQSFSLFKRNDQISHYVTRYLLQSSKIVPFFQSDPTLRTPYNYSGVGQENQFSMLDAGTILEYELFGLNNTVRNNSISNRKADLQQWIQYESLSELFFLQLLEFFTSDNNRRKSTMKTTIIVGVLKLVLSFSLLAIISALVSFIEQRFRTQLLKAVEILCKVSKTQLLESLRHLKLKINKYNLDVMEIEQENEEIVTVGGSTVPLSGNTGIGSTTLGKAATFHSSKSTLKQAHGLLGQKTGKVSKSNLYASNENLKKATAILKSKGKASKIVVHHVKKPGTGLMKRIVLFLIVLIIINIPVAAEAFFIFYFASQTTKIMDTTATANFLSISVYPQFAIQYKLLAVEYLDESQIVFTKPDWPFKSADTTKRAQTRKMLNNKMQEVRMHISDTRSLSDMDLLTMMTNLKMCNLIVTIKSRNESLVCLGALPGNNDISLLFATQSVSSHQYLLETAVDQAVSSKGPFSSIEFCNFMWDYFKSQEYYSNDLISYYLTLSAKDLSATNLEQVDTLVNSGKQILWIIFSSSGLLSLGFLIYFKLIQISNLDAQWRSVQQNFLLLNDDLLNNAYISMHFDKNSRGNAKSCTQLICS